MLISVGTWRRLRNRALCGLAVPALLALGHGPSAAEPPLPPSPAAATVPALDLAACRQIALEKQPAIAAARASLAAAQARLRGLEKLHGLSLLARDLPIRRHQAALGVEIAEAQLEQARWDTLYNVSRSYFAVVYARVQLKVADDAAKELNHLKEQDMKFGTGRVAEQIAVYLKVVEGRRQTAEQGVFRAMAALREAMGVGSDFCFQVADKELPRLNPQICRDDIVALALARRGEMIQAATAAEITGAEVNAQQSRLLGLTVPTFASGSDVHAQPIPQASRGAEYHPGAVGPEMPSVMVGCRSARVEQAKALTARASAVVEKTRHALTLEAEDAFHRWQETARRLPQVQQAADAAKKLADKLAQEAKNPDLNVRYSEAMNAGTLASQLRLEANETHFQLLLNLAALERVTAGGFSAGFEKPPRP